MADLVRKGHDDRYLLAMRNLRITAIDLYCLDVLQRRAPQYHTFVLKAFCYYEQLLITHKTYAELAGESVEISKCQYAVRPSI